MENEELRAAEAHIARLEEELLRLKDVKSELENLRTEHGRLRRTARGRIAQLLTAPVRWLGRSPSAQAPPETAYERWLTQHCVKASELPELVHRGRAWRYRPLVSILMATYDSDRRWLQAAMDSVRKQVYENWELLVADDGSEQGAALADLANKEAEESRVRILPGQAHRGISETLNRALAEARGEWIALLDHDDLLEPDALFRAVEFLQQEPQADVLYSDEDKIIDDRFATPMLKPDWSPEFFLTHDYLGHFLVLRRELVDRFRAEFDGAQDYDLLLRISERTQRFIHLPRVLYHWRRTPHSTAHNIRRKPGALDAGRRAIAEHLARKHVSARVSVDWATHGYRVRRQTRSAFLSIVLEQTAAERLRAITAYAHLEVVSSAADASGEYLLFLEQNLQPLEPSWLGIMAEYLEEPEIGAVGARILNSRGQIESAGYVLLADGTAKPAFAGWERANSGANRQLRMVRNCSAISASCLLTRRELLEKIGKLDPSAVGPVCAGVEYCLKLRAAGLRTVVIPYADLQRTSGTDVAATKCPEAAQLWPDCFQRDPFYHPDLSRTRADFSLGAMS